MGQLYRKHCPQRFTMQALLTRVCRMASLNVLTPTVFAAIKSSSLALLATSVDSVFDPLSNALLWYLHKKSQTLDVNKWPVGGSRLTTIGNICYGSLSV